MFRFSRKNRQGRKNLSSKIKGTLLSDATGTACRPHHPFDPKAPDIIAASAVSGGNADDEGYIDDEGGSEEEESSVSSSAGEVSRRSLWAPDAEFLLQLAKRPGATHESIIDEWNTDIRERRSKYPDYKPNLIAFDSKSPAWKSTPLWRPKRWGNRNALILSRIDLRGAWMDYADLEDVELCEADLRGARLKSSKMTEVDLATAKLDGADLAEDTIDITFFTGAELRRASLAGASLKGADLRGAHLEEVNAGSADFTGSNLKGASFDGSLLTSAKFIKVDLRYASLKTGRLMGAIFDGADLRYADFTRATGLYNRKDWNFRNLTGTVFALCDLSYGDFCGAVLRKTDFTQADVTGIRYRKHSGWHFPLPIRKNVMLGRYLGIRGVDSCYGDPGFRRDALDQDFIDDRFEDSRLRRDFPSCASSRWGFFLGIWSQIWSIRWAELYRRIPKRILFWLWSLTDYGRSVLSIFVFAGFVIAAFGTLYEYTLLPRGDVVFGESLAQMPTLPFRAWYAAAMGAATLGLTDLIHPRTWVGEVTMFANVLAGLTMFGMMIAVLQNKFARRA